MQSKYKTRKAGNRADFYGSWTNGVQTRPDRIAGRTITYNHHTGEWR